jgi:cytochrome c-type biogenesis protein CcmH
VRWILASLAIAHIFFVGVATQSRADDADAQLESRFRAFVQHVRCLVCQNEALSDSRAELAVDLRREIREQMKAGNSNEEITAFLTDRYGDFVLYRPPLKPTTYALWFGPFLLLAGGFIALYRSVTLRPLPDNRPLSAAQRKRIRQLLDSQRGEEGA